MLSRGRRGYAPPTTGLRKTHPSGVPLTDLPRLPILQGKDPGRTYPPTHLTFLTTLPDTQM